METTNFGTLRTGGSATLYTITGGGLTARITDYGACLVQLWVPDRNGAPADIVLGYPDVRGYEEDTVFLGATVGRSANRIGGSRFAIGGQTFTMTPNEGPNNLHSGPDFYSKRLWTVESHTDSAICLSLESPHGDQGFPGNAQLRVTYALKDNALHILYDGICDRDTVFNLTNHSYFNLSGHNFPAGAMDQVLTLHCDAYTVADAASIPTGEMAAVEGTPMDFRAGKAIGRDIGMDFPALRLQGGYDHNFAIAANPCALLSDPATGRTMTVTTDCPGIQFYAGNFLTGQAGKEGAVYGKRSGICLETQYFPDAIHNPQWAQPLVKAGVPYHSETVYAFA